jgi:uncharacterized membrane protein YkvA (DUF1232 family)
MPGVNHISLRERARLLKRDTLAVWYASLDRRTPWYAKVLAGLVTAYAFSPVDLVPDFIPVLGYLDDLILVPAGIALVLRLIPVEVMEDARRKAEVASAKPVNWWMGALVLLLWGILLFFVIRAGWRLLVNLKSN